MESSSGTASAVELVELVDVEPLPEPLPEPSEPASLGGLPSPLGPTSWRRGDARPPARLCAACLRELRLWLPPPPPMPPPWLDDDEHSLAEYDSIRSTYARPR